MNTNYCRITELTKSSKLLKTLNFVCILKLTINLYFILRIESFINNKQTYIKVFQLQYAAAKSLQVNPEYFREDKKK